MTRLRGTGRALSVSAGALAASVLALGDVPVAVIAVGIALFFGVAVPALRRSG